MSKFSRIVLHIGTQKTGTTSVQNTFAANRNRLRGHDLIYPVSQVCRPDMPQDAVMHLDALILAMEDDMPGHVRRRLRPDAWVDEALEGLRRAALEAPGATLMLSCEHLSGYCRPVHIAALKNRLIQLAARIEVLVFLRPQEELIPSVWAQGLKGGASVPLTERVADERWLRRFDRMRHVAPWGDIFGDENVTTRHYGGNTVNAVCAVLRLPAGAILARHAFENNSFNAPSAEIMRRLNALNLDEDERMRMRELLLQTEGPKVALSEGQRAEVRNHFTASNAEFSTRFLAQ